MKLVIVTQMAARGGTGVESHFFALADLAAENGFEVEIVTPNFRRTVGDRLLDRLIGVVRTQSSEAGILLARKLGRRRLTAAVRRAVADRPDQDVVVCAQDPLAAAAAIAARANRSFPVHCTVHFNVSEIDEMVGKGRASPTGPLADELARTENEAFIGVDHVVFVSRYMKNIVCKRHPDIDSKSLVIYNFFARDIEHSARERDLITIGTLETRKNQKFMIDVLAECNSLGQKLNLTVAGGGPDLELLRDHVERRGLQDQVVLLGHIDDAWRLISNHRLYVHAAHMESLPISLIEALASSTPVVAAPVGGIPEIVVDGVNGKHWDQTDVQGAARILIDLINDKSKMHAYSASARDRYESLFSLQSSGNKWLEFISKGRPEFIP